MARRNIGMNVYFELRAPREVAVQQSTACGARSGRRGQLAALGQLPGSSVWIVEEAIATIEFQHGNLRA